ncbi:hypothetical protein JD844_013473 [Phrynosoma platyrhinos]|uniref:Uncharacterized protein n=1 Tax=Phrynosoma platyrhinos TaxID=52577 RepID=A0ABQ7TL57_PHRPL|nr:hypothetical protein JD844_013473 [Phrynosoma platyrhinos]
MQELERERDALLHGLEMVDQVRDWFQHHLLEAQRRHKHMGAEAEVSEKSDRIAQLEQEKAALCKQLKESQGYRLPSHKASTFI